MAENDYPATRWLFQFQMLVHIGSFTEAAARMQMSQQALSKNIQALEQWAGSPLLKRQSSLSPTPQGQQLLQALPELLQSLQDIAQLRANPPDQLALGISYWLPFDMLIPMLQTSLAQTKTQLQLINLPETEIQAFLQAGELDMGLSLEPLDGPGIEVMSGQILHWQWVASPELLKQAAPYPWLQPGPLPSVLEPSLKGLHQLLRPVGEYPKWELLKALVLQGIGIACLPRPWVQPELTAGRLKTLTQAPFPQQITTPLYFSALPAQHQHPLAQDWRKRMGT